MGALALVVLAALFGTPRAEALEETSSVSTEARASVELTPYKQGRSWPARNVNGLDLLEPLVPLAASARGDCGRIVLGTALPCSLLVGACAFQESDHRTLGEIRRWKWLGVDEAQDNYPLLYGFLGLAGLSVLLPSAGEGASGHDWELTLDRLTVFGLGEGLAALEPEVLKPLFGRLRPNGQSHASRPSGHATTAFATAAFLSDILRDALRPQHEPNLGLRLLEEAATAVPYLGAFYISLERVHGNKHFLTDVLLGGALGAFTMHVLYAWSFTREEEGRGFLDFASVFYDPGRHALELALTKRF